MMMVVVREGKIRVCEEKEPDQDQEQDHRGLRGIFGPICW